MPSAVIGRRNVFSQMSERMSDGGKIGWNDWKSFPFDCCAIHCLPSAWKNVLRDIGESRYHAHYIRFSSFWRSFPIGSAAVECCGLPPLFVFLRLLLCGSFWTNFSAF